MPSILFPSTANISRCARLIRSGKLVVFPTETVYGLGANAFSESGVERIFAAKKRPKKNPVIVHVSSFRMLGSVIAKPLTPTQLRLLKLFWPGPLSVLFPRSDRIPSNVTAGLDTVAVRMPSNPIARRLIREAGVPIAAPSANPATRPSATLSVHAKKLRGVSAILDGGQSVFGIESTVLDLENQLILRPGPIGLSDLKPFLPNVRFHSSLKFEKIPKKVASPGMAFKHYSPDCAVSLVFGSSSRLAAFVDSLPEKTAVICSASVAKKLRRKPLFVFLSSKDLARNLFVFLHALDDRGFKSAVIQAVAERGIGFSVMNRLKKACSKKIRLT